MEYVLVAGGVVLAVGFRVICLILEFRGAFPQPKRIERDPMRLPAPRPVGVKAATRGRLAPEIACASRLPRPKRLRRRASYFPGGRGVCRVLPVRLAHRLPRLGPWKYVASGKSATTLGAGAPIGRGGVGPVVTL